MIAKYLYTQKNLRGGPDTDMTLTFEVSTPEAAKFIENPKANPQVENMYYHTGTGKWSVKGKYSGFTPLTRAIYALYTGLDPLDNNLPNALPRGDASPRDQYKTGRPYDYTKATLEKLFTRKTKRGIKPNPWSNFGKEFSAVKGVQEMYSTRNILDALFEGVISIKEAKILKEGYSTMTGGGSDPEKIANKIFAAISQVRGSGRTDSDIWEGEIGGETWTAFYSEDNGAQAWLAYQGDDPAAEEYGNSATAYFRSKKQLISWIKKIQKDGINAKGLHGEI